MAGIVDKFKRMWDAPDDEYEYDEYGYADDTMDDYDDAVFGKKYDRFSDKQLRGIAAIGRNKRGGDEYISGKGYMNK